jgi:hypothetical protein
MDKEDINGGVRDASGKLTITRGAGDQNSKASGIVPRLFFIVRNI